MLISFPVEVLYAQVVINHFLGSSLLCMTPKRCVLSSLHSFSCLVSFINCKNSWIDLKFLFQYHIVGAHMEFEIYCFGLNTLLRAMIVLLVP